MNDGLGLLACIGVLFLSIALIVESIRGHEHEPDDLIPTFIEQFIDDPQPLGDEWTITIRRTSTDG